MGMTATSLGDGTMVLHPHDSEKVTYTIDVGTTVRDKPKELTRKLLLALARHEYNIRAGGYEITIRKDKR